MPRATLSFKLPEEAPEFETASNGGSYKNALWEIDQFLRSKIKYSDGLSETEVKTFQEVRDLLHSILEDNRIEV